MSTQGLNADLPSLHGFDGVLGVAPKKWFVMDIKELTQTLKEKKKCTQKCKIFQKTSEDAGKYAEYMPFWRRFQDLVLKQFG